LSVEKFNIDGCEFDGTPTTIAARAGDQFGNPVPNGTTVNFVTEGGRIGAASLGSCQTDNGVCSVLLETQAYRPKGYSAPGLYNNCRVSILAYAVGEETFNDANSNGVYDVNELFEDLPDAFLNIEPLDRIPETDASSFLARSTLTSELVGDRLIPFQSDGRVTPQDDDAWGEAHVRGDARGRIQLTSGCRHFRPTHPYLCRMHEHANGADEVRSGPTDRREWKSSRGRLPHHC
jgi:hypothetical protein